MLVFSHYFFFDSQKTFNNSLLEQPVLFQFTLQLIRFRRHICGEQPSCSCNDKNFQSGISNCETVCNSFQIRQNNVEVNLSRKYTNVLLFLTVLLMLNIMQFYLYI